MLNYVLTYLCKLSLWQANFVIYYSSNNNNNNNNMILCTLTAATAAQSSRLKSTHIQWDFCVLLAALRMQCCQNSLASLWKSWGGNRGHSRPVLHRKLQWLNTWLYQVCMTGKKHKRWQQNQVYKVTKLKTGHWNWTTVIWSTDRAEKVEPVQCSPAKVSCTVKYKLA